jgi:hypothetical protein
MPRNLQGIPDRLTGYAILEAERVPTGEDKCMSCWRAFDTTEDSSDPTERPCHPVRLEPCNHLIGNHCLTELIRHSMTNCLRCTTPITFTPPVPFWITFLLTWGDLIFIPITWLPVLRNTIFYSESKSSAIFERLQDKLCKGTLHAHECVQLWYLYMLSPLIDTILVPLRFAAMTFVTILILATRIRLSPLTGWIYDHTAMSFSILGWYVRQIPTPISTLAEVAMYYLLGLYVNSWPREYTVEMFKLFQVLALGWEIGCAVLTGNIVLCGVLVAYLIWLGRSRKDKVL